MSTIRWLGGLIASILVAPGSFAAIAYDEAVAGDLSNDRGAPSALTFDLGSNVVMGAVGVVSGAKDLDYFTISLGTNQQLNALTVLPGTATGGSVSFIAVQAGSTMTLDPNALPYPDPAILLGWKHYSKHDAGFDILPVMGDAALTGSQGFKAPLGPGSYTFWVQETSPGPVSYKLEFSVSAVPEPGSNMLILAGLGAFAFLWRQRRKA